MAELATLARPYAEALFKASSEAERGALKDQMAALAALAGSAELRQFADNPKVAVGQIFDVVAGAVSQADEGGQDLHAKAANLLRAVLENGRLGALPEVAAQFAHLVNAQSGVSDAVIESAFPIEGAQLADVVATLEKRFARKLAATVRLTPELIGGIRVTVGDEVLDTSVKARLAQMRLALVA